jgi:hypothetical protein
MFPRDASTLIYDNPTNNSLLLGTSSGFTFLHGEMICNNTTADVHITFGHYSSSTLYYLDREANTGNKEETFGQYSTSSPLYYTESTGVDCIIRIVYVPRDRRVTPDPQTSTTTNATTSVITIGSSTLSVVPTMTTVSYIYLVMATVAFFTYIFKK